MTTPFQRFDLAINYLGKALVNYGYEVQTKRWHAKKTSPQHRMIEVLNQSITVPMNLDRLILQERIKPNLPWADDHFAERVGGEPLNPAPSHAWWPYNQRGNIQHQEMGVFTHTYPERMWASKAEQALNCTYASPPYGIRYEYGDLSDLLDMMQREPDTRQAYLPIWFPEDTGAKFKGRVPCSLGYWFIRRNGYLHCTYHIRSCDYVRHLRDDIYMAVRLAHWVLNQLQSRDAMVWNQTDPGMFTMHIGSLHAFANEREVLRKQLV